MEHYIDLIWQFGSADRFNTEFPKHLHIDYAKEAYHLTNKKDYIAQVIVWLQCQEAVNFQSLFLEWCLQVEEGAMVVGLEENEDVDMVGEGMESSQGGGREGEDTGTEETVMVTAKEWSVTNMAVPTPQLHTVLCQGPTSHPPHL